jgi:hypothetical protein
MLMVPGTRAGAAAFALLIDIVKATSVYVRHRTDSSIRI